MSETHFITIPTFHRKRLFQNQRFGDLLAETLMQCCKQQKILLHDYVIMPDHVHLLITIQQGTTVADVVHLVQSGLEEELSRQYGYAGEVWAHPYRDQPLEHAEECAAAVRFIQSNPVRLGFCQQAREYAMSSKASRWMLDPLPEPLKSGAAL
jgi:putative transposase